MGTPEFALPALERLVASRHEIVLVVTQPDRPAGRGRKLTPPPVKLAAEAHGLPVVQSVSVRKEGIAERIRALKADVSVVAAFGQILPRDVLDATPLGCLNIHPSLLPAYRGAAPIQRCLLEGNDVTGVTIMKLVLELDAGPIVSQQRLDILDDDDARSVADMTAVMGADMLLRVLDEAEERRTIDAVEQDHAASTYAPPIKKEEGEIPWGDTTHAILCRMRAMAPWPGAYTWINGERQISVVQGLIGDADGGRAENAGDKPPAPGTVTELEKGIGFHVRTGNGTLLVTRVKPEGKSEMDAAALINGRQIAVGDVLGPKREGKESTA
jgi:methionyl-tRNA formyltransferase